MQRILMILVIAAAVEAEDIYPSIPRTWDDAAIVLSQKLGALLAP